MATLTLTPETYVSPDPNYPTGWNQLSDAFGGSCHTFDFTSNTHFAGIYGNDAGGVGRYGIVTTNLSTMGVIHTTTQEQMYAGTAFGPTPGVPWGVIWEVTCGNGTDLFLLTGTGDTSYTDQHLVRVNPATMKVTGEFYISAGGPSPIVNASGHNAVVNKTASHTIVAIPPNPVYHSGPQIFDGTNMVGVGVAGPPLISLGYAYILIPGPTHPDGSCDFIMVNYDRGGTSGDVAILRVNVTNGLAITTTHTGTLNVLSLFDASNFWVGQANYDVAQDHIILWAQSAINGPPTWMISANWDGSINWVQGPLADIRTVAGNRGQSQLTGNTLMIGAGHALKILNTTTGAITFTGSVENVDNPHYFEVWDAARRAYWYYALATFGFIRIDLEMPALALDDLVCTTLPTLTRNLVSLRWSDDRGHSFGSPVTQPIGEAGEYRTSLQWQRLGVARDRVFSISWSVPMATALQGCWVDVTPAQS